MTRAWLLYLVSLGIHTALLCLFSQYYRKNPIFMLWLLAALMGQAPLWALYWAREYRAYGRALATYDGLWYLLLLAAIGVALTRRAEAINAIILRGAIFLLICTIAARLAARIEWAGGLGAAAASVVNFSFLIPVSYMVWALARLREDLLPLWVAEAAIQNSRFKIQEAAGWARAMLG